MSVRLWDFLYGEGERKAVGIKVSEAFDLVAAQMEAHKLDMVTALNRERFAAGEPYVPEPVTWRDTVRRHTTRVREYLRTLGQALRGVSLREPYEYDED